MSNVDGCAIGLAGVVGAKARGSRPVARRKCDATFAANVPGLAKDSASMEWDRLVAREAGSDLLELSKNLVRAYVRKMGDAKVDATMPRTVWGQRALAGNLQE